MRRKRRKTKVTFGSSGGSTEGRATTSRRAVLPDRPVLQDRGLAVKGTSRYQARSTYDPNDIHSWHVVAPDASPGEDACEEFKRYFERLKRGH